MSVKLPVKFQEFERQSDGIRMKQTEVCRITPSEGQLHGETPASIKNLQPEARSRRGWRTAAT